MMGLLGAKMVVLPLVNCDCASELSKVILVQDSTYVLSCFAWGYVFFVHV